MLNQTSSQVMTSYGKFWCQCYLSEIVISGSQSGFNYNLISLFKEMVDSKITTKTKWGKGRFTVMSTRNTEVVPVLVSINYYIIFPYNSSKQL